MKNRRNLDYTKDALLCRKRLPEQFKTAKYANTTPLLKDLYEYVTPYYAADWRIIGTLLGLSREDLKIIQHDNHHKAVPCCNAVLEKWLEVDPSASWNKLLGVIQSPAITSPSDKVAERDAEMVSTFSNKVTTMNAQAWHRADKHTWPPEQSHSFTPLLLVHHEGQERMDQSVEIAKLVYNGDVPAQATEQSVQTKLDEKAPHASKVTKKVTEILAPLEKSNEPQFIMIEGVPGIGKSVLLREIAFRWGKKRSLQEFTLLLLVCLRDPTIQQATTISDLLLSYCKGDRRAKEMAAACSDHLFATEGKRLLFLFDGFDEYPEHLRENSLIGEILNRNILPLCGLVVSSRPHASVTLREQATIKVDILGFSEEERHQYIEHSLKGRPQCVNHLTRYLQDHLTINNLCLVPFNIAILLFLCKMNIPLPSDSSKLYHHFICLTINRHLAKYGRSFKSNIKELNDLPDPYSKIVGQLSMLALQALNNNQLVFTYDEIEAACPDITASPEAINGFGLLQAVQHYHLTGKTTTFNFLHLTIQEYLAAYYMITTLQPDEELYLLREQFWSDLHANMFAIYVTLTKGQRSSFKKFLSDGDDKIAISDRFLHDQLKCLRLYRCFKEAGDCKMCKSIEEAAIFSEKKINLHSTSNASATDLECVSFFLTSSSNKQWEELNLSGCHIQDCGFHIIYKYLNNCDITVTKLWLSDNCLTKFSSSYTSKIVLSCKVEELRIIGNRTIGECGELYTMLTHPSSMLTLLNMNNTSLTPAAAKILFTAVKDSRKLKVLWINYNNITDDVADDIFVALSVNKSLVELWAHGNQMSGEAIETILHSQRGNHVLQLLVVSSYPSAIEDRIRSKEEEINTKRKSHRIQNKLTVSFWY